MDSPALNTARTYFNVKIISPDGEVAAAMVYMLSASTLDGEIALLKNHLPLVTSLQPGLVIFYCAENEKVLYFIAGGFLEMTDHCSILVEEAILVNDMDAPTLEKGLELLAQKYHESTTDAQKNALKSDRQILQAKLDLVNRLVLKK